MACDLEKFVRASIERSPGVAREEAQARRGGRPLHWDDAGRARPAPPTPPLLSGAVAPGGAERATGDVSFSAATLRVRGLRNTDLTPP